MLTSLMPSSGGARLQPAIGRRGFLAGASAAVAAATIAAPHVARAQAPFAFDALPYADNALDPVISSNTIGFHYGKHHKGYLDNLNKLLADNKDLSGMPMLELMKTTGANPTRAAIFNNAAQVWNHTFYWKSMRPGGGGQPSGALLDKINADFGGFDKFKEQMKAMAMGQFGSGWAWLVLEQGKLKCVRTPNAETPATVQDRKPLLTIDVWEHAYYLDYQNRRADYVDAVMDKLLNWEFAAANLG